MGTDDLDGTAAAIDATCEMAMGIGLADLRAFLEARDLCGLDENDAIALYEFACRLRHNERAREDEAQIEYGEDADACPLRPVTDTGGVWH